MSQSNLDPIYKTRLPESHEAGLQAVYEHGLADAAQAFLNATAPEPVPVPPEQDPVI